MNLDFSSVFTIIKKKKKNLCTEKMKPEKMIFKTLIITMRYFINNQKRTLFHVIVRSSIKSNLNAFFHKKINETKSLTEVVDMNLNEFNLKSVLQFVHEIYYITFRKL